MADVYAKIGELDPAALEQLAHVLELRAMDHQQQQMRADYFANISFPPDARVLEVGCGTGVVARALAARPEVAEVIGLDPSPALLSKAQSLSAGIGKLRFVQGEASALKFSEHAFDVVVFHTALCHIPHPQAALSEAFRVLQPGGSLAIFDANYADTTLATSTVDPLQSCAQAAVNNIALDPWLVPRLRALVEKVGYRVLRFQSYIYDGIQPPDYMLTIVDRGADALHKEGRVGAELAVALKAEARRRVQSGEFFGQITYASLIAAKPADAARRSNAEACNGGGQEYTQ
jgi:ubiquinone/menaquinone biosynthesis C-methylase UbiE